MTSSSESGPMDRAGPGSRIGPGGDYTPQLRPAGVTVTLPAAPTTPLAAVHPDARTVGTLLARYAYLIRDLGGLESKKSVRRRCCSRLLDDAEAGRTAIVSSRPVSARGKRLRTEGIAGFIAAKAVARSRLELVGLRQRESLPPSGSRR